MAELEVRFSGSGGQGILLVGRILAQALVLQDLNVAQSQSYEPTSRGGLSRADLVASSGQVDYPLATSLDQLVILHQIAGGASNDILKDDTLVVIDSPLGETCSVPKGNSVLLPISETARALGNLRSTNMVALGALMSLAEICAQETVFEAVKLAAPGKLVDTALAAVREGYRIAVDN
ncbi:MAG: pyruvate ferredoxin oxidoreductase [Halieaceae bacterium]|jgi:2-oxoglutarate ferredoxin oxidoreductase subunit gamma|nr:pyruvate ferredoxin oxidoreductase [Halieaceae bacterium]